MRLLPLLSVSLVLVLMGLGRLPASAQALPDRPREQFEAANEAYARGEYGAAVKGYRTLLKDGYASGALYHNLGNAYVRLDSVGLAVWAYEKARQLRPDDVRLRHNLEYVRRRAGLSQLGLPPRGLAALVAGWPPLLLFVGGLLLLTGGLLTAVFWTEADQYTAWRAPRAWGPVVAGVVLVGGAMGASYVQAHERRAVVTTGSVPLRKAPTETAAPDSTLRGGTMVEVEGTRPRWHRVRLGDGTTGWVLGAALREV